MAEPHYDLIVVGGGIVGVCTAYFAAHDTPGRRTLLIERSMIGTGATQFSVGMALPYGYTPLRRSLALESHILFKELRRTLPTLPIRDLPLFGICSAAKAQEVIDNFVLTGVHCATKEEVEQLRLSYPNLQIGSDQVVLAGGVANYTIVHDVARALSDDFRRCSGSECWEGVEVTAIERSGNVWTVCTADGRAVTGAAVIDATGPWMPEGPSRDFAEAQGIRVKKVAAMQVESPPPPGAPVLFFFDDDAFLLPLHETGRWLFSFTLQVWDVLPRTDQLALTAHDRGAAVAVLDRYMPSLTSACTNARVFADAYTPNWTPVIGRVREGNYVAVGAGCGSGYRLAPAMARRALALVADKERIDSALDLSTAVHP